MLDSIQSLLDAFPEGVVQAHAGYVLAVNEKARQYLPQLEPGGPLPAEIPLPPPGETETGTFTLNGRSYSCSCKAVGEEYILLFRPAARSALESWQMDGILRQLREFLGDILAEAWSAAPGGTTSAAFNKTFYRLFRLTGNLEFMQEMAEDGVPFRPMTMNLDDLCWKVTQQAGDLLREAGISLEYVFKGQALLIPGDGPLLGKMLLGLMSNAARLAGGKGGGVISVTLYRRGDQARLLVSGGGTPDERQMDALFQGGPVEGIPFPGQGAGLGLSIARHIAQLHGGTLLPYGGGSSPGVLVSLPTGPLSGRTSVRRSQVQQDGGLDPVLVELSDVLPASVFGLEGLD